MPSLYDIITENMRRLSFSSSQLSIFEVEITKSHYLNKPSLVLNLSKKLVTVGSDDNSFGFLKSRFLQSTNLKARGAIVCIAQVSKNNFNKPSQKLVSHIKKSWNFAYDLYPHVKELKSLTMYKSPKDKVNKFELNLWYLKANTNGRIHKDHDFNEVHMQILGTGLMQKFKSQKYEDIFETTYMPPGYTHYPFYDSENRYPWHSYSAVTDCVWLAVEKHAKKKR